MARLSHTKAILGKNLFAAVRETPLLVVGAGGIGCELLKNLVLVGFANIEIIDLDTIDLSNLNRQFLFRKPDIGKPKSLVAAVTARHFNPSSGIEINARHGNLKDAENDIAWISKFGLVLSALDNVDARRHLNRLCQAAKVPLIESGTAGYQGQVIPIIPDMTECYDCTVKAAPKSFPVCTIRSTPSEPIHCIVWGKSYLLNKLFGEDDEALDEAELDKAKAEGENPDEINNLKKEAAAFREVRRLLGDEGGPKRVFEKVFYDDINRLLSMEDMWKKEGRIKPLALEYDAIMAGTFEAPPPRTTSTTAPPPATTTSTLKDQKQLSLKDNLELFLDSSKRLAARVKAYPDVPLAFDKDDGDTLDFVLAVANLRAIAYRIATRTRFEVKQMAGNIIPAIATTNAVISGLVVMQALKILQQKHESATLVNLQKVPEQPLKATKPFAPNESCAVCRDVYVTARVSPSATLGTVLERVQAWLAPSLGDDVLEASVLEGTRVLADPDFEDNLGRTLADLGVGRGATLTLIDEDDKYRPIHVCVLEGEGEGEGEEEIVLPDQPPALALRPAKAASESDSDDSDFEVVEQDNDNETETSKKRAAENDGEERDGKKRKVESESDPVVIDDDEDYFEILP